MVAWLTYEDIETDNFVVLQHLHAKTDRLMLIIRQMQLDAGGAPAKPDEVAAGLALPNAADLSNDLWGLPAEELQQQYRQLHPAMVGQGPTAKGPKGQGQASKGGGGGGGGKGFGSLAWFFGVYFFFQWLLGRGS